MSGIRGEFDLVFIGTVFVFGSFRVMSLERCREFGEYGDRMRGYVEGRRELLFGWERF